MIFKKLILMSILLVFSCNLNEQPVYVEEILTPISETNVTSVIAYYGITNFYVVDYIRVISNIGTNYSTTNWKDVYTNWCSVTNK